MGHVDPFYGQMTAVPSFDGPSRASQLVQELIHDGCEDSLKARVLTPTGGARTELFHYSVRTPYR